MNNSKLTHLKPSLARAYDRANARYNALGNRILAVGVENADEALLRQFDIAQDRMYDLVGICMTIETAIDLAVNPESFEPEPIVDPADIQALQLKQ